MKPSCLWVYCLVQWVCFGQSYNHYFGNIHAHSGYSDGNKDSLSSGLFTPIQDFTYAKTSQHVDFYGISEHNHSNAGMMSKQNYYNGVADAKFATVEDTFVALYGMEWGIISQGGHVVIYGYDSLIGWETNLYDIYVQPHDFGTLWNVINSKPNCFGYLAHPQATDFDSLLLKPLDPAADQAVVGLPFRSGPAFSQNITYSNPSSANYWSRYTQALKLGYHVGIGLDHDTHYSVFGRSQQGRMGLIAPNLTKNDLMYALRKMHFYSSDDWNFKPTFKINEQPMGSILEQSGNPTLFIDCIDMDLSETVSSIYIYYGVPGSGQQATLLTQINGLATATYTDNVPDGTTRYYYARIVQGDGDEIFTSPIWYTRNDNSQEMVPQAHFTSNAEPACLGVPLALSYDGTGTNNQYFWSFSNGVTPAYSTAMNPTIDFDHLGTYHVTVYVENAAGTSFYTQEIVVAGCAGIPSLTSNYLIYPNPASHEITLELEDPSQIDGVTLLDAMGRTVKTWPIEKTTHHVLDIQELPEGVYIIYLQGTEQRFVEPVWIHK